MVYVLIYALMSICGFSVLGWTRALIIEVAGLSRESAVSGVTLGLTFFFSTVGILKGYWIWCSRIFFSFWGFNLVREREFNFDKFITICGGSRKIGSIGVP